MAVPEIVRALELAEEARNTPGERNLYESYWDQVSREKTLVMDSCAQGRAMGIEEAIAEIAINMLKENESFYKISQFTGLSQDTIIKLKSERLCS